MEKWAKLDEQFQNWSPRLRDDLRIGAKESNKLATTIALELSQIPEEKAKEVRGGSVIPFEDRIKELTAFQAFMDYVHRATDPRPAIVRAQVILQNYVCFVYLGECFKTLRALLPTETTTRKCCAFLTDNPVCISKCRSPWELEVQRRL